ncbi:MAG: hypothetical protein A2V88_12240 [Elusimicrobia bacterium RBG_16_66_12]|nr:MAG: hypothetical protein A2V88_12240 [Elusimicrobia bacterium RBG_16_66_12]
MGSGVLSKSQYVRGLQCPKSLWLYRNRKDLIPPSPPGLQRNFDQGHAIGRLARARFPGGVDITADYLHQQHALDSTAAAVNSGARTIYEAAALFDKTLVRSDILNRNADGTWDLVEVKGATDVNDVYLQDLAIQAYILEGAGFRLRRAILMHVNNQYVRRGPINPKSFFTLVNLTVKLKPFIKAVPAEVRRLHRVLSSSASPKIDIGPHCSSPYECSFQEHCWRRLPDYSIYDLVRIREGKIIQLKGRGVLKIAEVPEDFPLSRAQEIQVLCEKTKKAHIEKVAIGELLDTLVYPLHYLDFETLNPAIPPYDGLRPFQQMPFQASIHVQETEGAPIKHVEYLGDGRSDPRPGLVECLASSISGRGTVIAYNAGFEGQCLRSLAGAYPKRAKALLSAANRLWDLGDPFRKSFYVDPAFKGSWSIKAVLPVLVPSMTYKNLPVGNGEQAQLAFLALMSGNLPAAERKKTVRNLKIYCGQDTFAMVKILAKLQKIRGSC